MNSCYNDTHDFNVFISVNKTRLCILFLMFAMMMVLPAMATHNRAGEIIYSRVNATNPFLYEISIITYTKTGGQSDAADRCELELFFGDGSSAVVNRVNGPLNQGCDAGVGIGVMIATQTRYNVYSTTHEFPGAGTYKLSMEDPMRNGGVLNIPNSDNVPFYLESYLTIDIATGGNRAPVLQNPPIDNGCVGIPFYHNPGAVDLDGDSLVYSVVQSRSYSGQQISGYQFPDDIEPGINNVLSIDPNTGTLSWVSPQTAGEYNVAILIEEYRTNPNSGAVFKVGSIMRDMQIDIGNCPPNNPPIIEVDEKACVTAGSVLQRNAIATDLEGDRLTFSAVGFPLDEGNGGSVGPADSASGFPPIELRFRWQTSCDHVRKAPYWVYFKAKENEGLSSDLVIFKTLEIEVKSPAVSITSVEPAGTSLVVEWTKAQCEQAIGYDVYRYNDSLGYEASECVTGVPSGLGYELVGEIDDIDLLQFVDDNNGKGLIHGQRYCYLIVTKFSDGSESYPSEEGCGKLIRDVPILNMVSVVETDIASGSDSIAWYKPIEMKLDVFGPPYQYRLSRAESLNGDYQVVYLSPESNDPFSLDTMFFDQNLNTLEKQYFYSIEMLSGSEKVSIGNSVSAASIYLTSEPSDNALTLSWRVDVPWKNNQYIVYRFSNHPDSLSNFKALDTVTSTMYIDERLANTFEYRYFVKSIGEYTAADLQGVLVNNSQVHTGIPIDNEVPCIPPGLLIQGDCDLEQATISWSNPNELCEDTDDVIGFRVYYSPFLGQELTLLEEIEDPTQTEFIKESEGSIAGCYALVAVDSFNNESSRDQALCVDNCPLYELPNVFSPGSDGINDLFIPFPYKFVESVDITIYNRWGVQVFSSQDPDINWDGTEARSGKPLPSGVYYYVCQVNEIRLTGIETRELKGNVHLIREGENEPPAY
jgi:gliding motility-associated-like protein